MAAQPALYLDFDFAKQIVNITPQDNSKAQPGLVKTAYSAAYPTLVANDFQSGFQVVDYQRLEFGLGARLAFWFENASGIA